MQSDDRHLVRRCLAGEQRAFDTLYDRHAGRVFHLLRRLTANEAEAEDLAQAGEACFGSVKVFRRASAGGRSPGS
jgi:DNA-directed RNA polymerase specialized sigma24 family protein